MTDLHKAARQALEALELAQTDVHWELNSPTRKFLRKAEKNLRAALTEPVEPVPQPGVWMHPWPPVKAQPAPELETCCTWHQDGDSDSGVYATSCGHYFNLEDGTPEDNEMSHCCYCGKKLAQELITEGTK